MLLKDQFMIALLLRICSFILKRPIICTAGTKRERWGSENSQI